MIEAGSPAPDFALVDQDGNRVPQPQLVFEALGRV